MPALFLSTSPKEYAKTVSKRATRGPNLSGAFFFLIINLKLLYGMGVVDKMLGTFSLAMLIGKAYQNHSLNYYAISDHLGFQDVSQHKLHQPLCLATFFFLVLRSRISA